MKIKFKKLIEEHRNTYLIKTIILTFLIVTISFLMSDTPDKKYLNPYYVDIIITIAGIILIIDAFKDRKGWIYSAILRTCIGISIITIHLWQFIFDLVRGYNF